VLFLADAGGGKAKAQKQALFLLYLEAISISVNKGAAKQQLPDGNTCDGPFCSPKSWC
jgi:hypothetical protein